jgi:glycosyltransferase involved in cell wall biosynthesis
MENTGPGTECKGTCVHFTDYVKSTQVHLLQIIQVNAAYDPEAKTPDALLDRYTTLTGWSTAISGAGASVSVLQRFRSAATVQRDGIPYTFVDDSDVPWLSTRSAPQPLIDAAVSANPDLVHVNGLIFPALLAGLRRALPARVAIVAQHHGGEFPVRGAGVVGWLRERRWRHGLAAVDACSFTAAEQADAWRKAGVLGPQPVLEIVEAGTHIRAVSRDRAREVTGLAGAPLLLWVGRLTPNKDPLTVLDGLELALTALPQARVAMVFAEAMLGDRVAARIEGSAILRDRVTLVGHVPHDEIANYYAAADVFLSGSHAEGSGYALIEAMACGLIPVVTDIPSFRTIAGSSGARWTAGDATAFAAALQDVCSRDRSAEREKVRQQFDDVVRWEAIAKRTVAAYQDLVERRRAKGLG